MPRLLLWLTSIALVVPGCDRGGDDDDTTGPPGDDDTACEDVAPVGLLDDEGLYPYPSMHLMAEDPDTPTGWRLAFEADTLPVSDGGSPLDTARLNRLDGFSVANAAVVLMPDAEIDGDCLPSVHDLGSSVQTTSAVQLIDLDRGERVPCFAELDAHPQCTGPENRVLLVRPMRAMQFDTRHAVVLTSALVGPDGQTVATPERFAALRDGGDVHPGLCDRVEHYEVLFTDLEALGLQRSDLVLAWDFRTGSEQTVHAPLDRIIERGLEELPADAGFAPDYTVDWVSDSDLGYDLPPHVWRLTQGSYRLPSYLDDGGDGAFVLDEDALPRPQGDDDVFFMAMIPPSVHDAPAGSVPVVVFGHGIFSNPNNYLGDDDDPSDVQALADRLGMIFIGTKWRGLASDDMVSALVVANDFGQFHHITDKMVQGVANAVSLPRMVQTSFVHDEFFAATDGSGSLVDTDRVYYMGISLGGIEGFTLMANSDELQHAVLHVPGAMWSTMLERSSNWAVFDGYVMDVLPQPHDRQALYAVTQLLWDPSDPITHTHGVAGKSLLWQESMGDEQVPNMTLEALVRSVGAPVLVPTTDPPYAVEELTAPTAPDATALMQFDPGMGRPSDENRPAEATGAHYFPRHTDEAHAQIEQFFTAGEEGTIMHPCSDEPCAW